ncbi:hypothetical protein ACEQPO_08510 [Bacillus sp. SL00103]
MSNQKPLSPNDSVPRNEQTQPKEKVSAPVQKLKMRQLRRQIDNQKLKE